MIRNEIRFILILILVLYLSVVLSGKVYGQIPTKIPNLLIQDHTKTLSEKDKLIINEKLKEFKTNNKFDFGVAIVPSVDIGSFENYTQRMASIYGIGSKLSNQPGVLLVIFLNDKKARFTIGNGMDKIITLSQLKVIEGETVIPQMERISKYNNSYDWKQLIMTTLLQSERQIKDNYKPPINTTNVVEDNNSISIYGWFFIIGLIGIPVLLYILFKDEQPTQFSTYPNNSTTGFGLTNPYYKSNWNKVAVNEDRQREIIEQHKNKQVNSKPWQQPSSFHDKNAEYDIPKALEDTPVSKINSNTTIVVKPIIKRLKKKSTPPDTPFL